MQQYSAEERAVLGAMLTVMYVKAIGELWKIALCRCPRHAWTRNSRH